ncbi:MAG TPA: hypothetical protein VF853_00555 [Candidatus Deferrimicrobiaceae bacterium]
MERKHRRAPGPGTFLIASAILLLGAAVATAAIVDVDVVGDGRGTLPEYEAPGRVRPADTNRAYVEALRGERYAVRVTNRTGVRVGLVIAVDGRNIISGKKSHLRPDERMYILPPHESATYEGWRTERDTVNRFYFTDPGDSYAAAFGDRSAMGVVAVAVYREKEIPVTYDNRESREWNRAPAQRGGTPGAESAAPRAAAPHRKSGDAGTGFGEEHYSPAVRVEFEPERQVAERHFLKYEWKETLCRKGVIDCRWSRNRFWDDDGYAPYPPGRGRGR